MKIKCALYLGRNHRLQSLKAIEKNRVIDINLCNTVASVEALEFYAGLMKTDMMRNSTEAQLHELVHITHDIHSKRVKQTALLEKKKRIDVAVEKAVRQWRDAWAAVEEVLDLIWTKANILKAHADSSEEGKEDTVATSSESDNQGANGLSSPHRGSQSGQPRVQLGAVSEKNNTSISPHATKKHLLSTSGDNSPEAHKRRKIYGLRRLQLLSLNGRKNMLIVKNLHYRQDPAHQSNLTSPLRVLQ